MNATPTEAAAARSASAQRHERYLAIDPGNAGLRCTLIGLYIADDRLEEAQACLAQGLSQHPGHTGLLECEADLALAHHDFAAAQQMLQSLSAAAPEDAVLLHKLGVALAQQARWPEALQALEAACARGADDAQTHAYLAYARHHTGHLPQALEAARVWAERAASPEALGYLALVEMDNGEMEAAFARAQSVLVLEPGNVNASVVSGLQAIELQDMGRASERFETVLRLEPNNARGWVGVALARLHAGEPARAIEAFERALALDPHNTGTVVGMGWARFTTKDYAGAERDFRRAIEIDRNFAEAHGGLASALVLQDQRHAAREAIERARRLDPNSFGLVYAQSVLLALEGRAELGQRIMGRALDRSVRPGTPSLIDYARQFMRQKGLQQGPLQGPGSDGPTNPPAGPPA